MTDMLNIGVADPIDGVPNSVYDSLKWILDIIYDGMSSCSDVLAVFGGSLRLTLKSGVSFSLLDNGDVPDFRMPARTWSWWSIYMHNTNLRLNFQLPNISLNADWVQWLTVSTYFPGTQDLQYEYVENGVKMYKPGSEFNPPKGYGLVNLLDDIYPWLLVIIVVYLFVKLGLTQVALAVLRSLLSLSWKKPIWDTNDRVRALQKDLDDMNEFNANKFDKIRQKHEEIDMQIGNIEASTAELETVIDNIKSELGLTKTEVTRIRSNIGLKLSL